METQPIPDLLVTKLGRPEKDELIKRYWIKGESAGRIALDYSVEAATIIGWLIKYDIPIRGYYQTLQLAFFEEGGVAVTTKVTLQHEIPFDCLITSIAVHFPSGCNSLVQVYLQKADGAKIFPYKGEYIALDGATEVFYTQYFLASGTRLQTVISNTDDSNTHNVEVITTIQRLSVIPPKST